ncbi:MAG: hypothetical protein ACFFEX_08135 [Candidatus Thorarchaeota archaeon]
MIEVSAKYRRMVLFLAVCILIASPVFVNAIQGYFTTLSEDYISSYDSTVYSSVSCSSSTGKMKAIGVHAYGDGADEIYMYVGVEITPSGSDDIKMGADWTSTYKIWGGFPSGEVSWEVWYYLYDDEWDELDRVKVYDDHVLSVIFNAESSATPHKHHYNYYEFDSGGYVAEGNTYYLVVYFKIWMNGNSKVNSATGSGKTIVDVGAIAYVSA